MEALPPPITVHEDELTAEVVGGRDVASSGCCGCSELVSVGGVAVVLVVLRTLLIVFSGMSEADGDGVGSSCVPVV